jgi:BASS family bile acid:Na+ symporter
MSELDAVRLQFSPDTLFVMNLVIGLILFGVALDLRVADFQRAIRQPRAPVTGLVCQFLLLPALTFALIPLLAPSPSMALGMLLVASCPGGNLSNFMTQWARGDLGTSVSMTAVSTAAALVVTPLNLAFWGSLRPDTAAILHEVALDPLKMAQTVAVLLVIPVASGMTLAARRPDIAARLRTPMQHFSLVAFGAFVVGAFAGNFDHFMAWVGLAVVPVAVMNGGALFTGWAAGTLVGASESERRAIALEVGIQNSGLGLILVFDFFDGLGGMAVICAWWGIWHIAAGLALSSAWRFWGRVP